MVQANPTDDVRRDAVSGPLTVGRGCDQLRFVVPLPDRLGYAAHSGDVLVTLTRSVHGSKDAHQESAHTLGLLRIGDQALIRSSDYSALSAAYTISHLVAITFYPGHESPVPTRRRHEGHLRIPGTDWYLPRDNFDRTRRIPTGNVRRAIETADYTDSLPPGARTVGGGLVKSKKLREEFGLEGGYYEFANEEYMHIEVDDSGASILWSSRLGADRAVEVVREIFGEPDPDCEGFVVSMSGNGTDEPSPKVMVTAKSHPKDLRMFSIGFDDCLVSWRTAQVKMRKGSVPHVELAFNAKHVDTVRLERLMARTATPRLGQALAEGGSDLIKSIVRPGSKGRRKKR